jgi:hypothetical protein
VISRRSLMALLGLAPVASAASAAPLPPWLPSAGLIHSELLSGELLPMLPGKLRSLPLWSSLPPADRVIVGPWRRRLLRKEHRHCRCMRA